MERCNARYLPAKSLFMSALFGECFNAFYNVDFDKSQAEEQTGGGDIVFLVPNADISVADLEAGGKWFQSTLNKYLKRKYPNIEARVPVGLSQSVKEVRLWSRYRFHCGSDVQIASVYRSSSRFRPSHFVAAEMDGTETTADLYYGRLMKLVQFRLRPDAEIALPSNFEGGEHKVAVLQWANGIKIGKQKQL